MKIRAKTRPGSERASDERSQLEDKNKQLILSIICGGGCWITCYLAGREGEPPRNISPG